MFHKATITLFCLAIVSSAYAMEREPNNNGSSARSGSSFYNRDNIPAKSYAYFVGMEPQRILSESLAYANDYAEYFERIIPTFRGTSFEDIHKCAESAYVVYLALIKQGYKNAFKPAFDFAGKAFAFKGTGIVYIPSMDSCNKRTPQFQDALMKENRLYILLMAAKIYAALLENDKEYDNYHETALSCADFIINQISKNNLCDNWSSLHYDLYREAGKIYAHLILAKDQHACINGGESADLLADQNTNYVAKTAAAWIYAALLTVGYNFDVVSEEAKRLLALSDNKKIIPYKDIPLILYTGFVKSGDGEMSKDAFQFLKTNQWPNFGYDSSTTELMFKLCIALLQKYPDYVGKYFQDYASRLMIYAEKNKDYFTVRNAMPFLIALNTAGLLSGDDLETFENMIPSDYNS